MCEPGCAARSNRAARSTSEPAAAAMDCDWIAVMDSMDCDDGFDGFDGNDGMLQPAVLRKHLHDGMRAL